VFAGLLREMRVAVPFICTAERQALRQIMAHESGALTVGDLFPDFSRESEALITLRRLRTAQFIRPAGKDVWERDSRIEVKPFARLAWARLGEAAIFGEVPDADPVEEDIDLALPEVNTAVNEKGSEETMRVQKNKEASKWDDEGDDVLDFLHKRKGVLD
jgi:hypothetical protein